MRGSFPALTPGATVAAICTESGERAMTEFRYDHVHLRSPDPAATAAFYQKMFGAAVIKSVMSNGIERTDIRLGSVNRCMANVPNDAERSEKPENSFVGLDH